MVTTSFQYTCSFHEMDKTRAPNEMNTTPNFSNRRLNSGAGNMHANQEYPDHLNSPNEQNTQSVQNDRQPQYAGPYTVIPPNQSRRSEMQRVAQKEEQALQRWREQNRPGPIQLAPSQLGGAISLAEARQKQFVQSRQSKFQKQLQKQEMDRRKREEEEEKNRAMKEVQRQKAVKLAERRKQEELQRRCEYSQDHQARNQAFLQRFDQPSAAPAAAASSPPAASWERGREYREAQRQEENMHLKQKREEQRMKSEVLEGKQNKLEEQRLREIEMDRRRVNSAFLDKIDSQARSAEEAEPEEQADPQVLERPLGAAPSPALAEQDGSDGDWVVMKLLSDFPYYERGFLEDIVDQCDGDYRQAHSLLQ